MGDILEDYLRIKAEYDASTGSFSRDVNAESAQADTPTWANQDPDPTYDDPEEQAVMSSRKRYPENPTLDLYSRFVAEKEIRDLREQKSAAIGQKNLEARNPFMRGLYRGFDTLQGTYQGGLGMLSSLAGDETSAQQRFQAYQDEMRQASENPRDNIDFFSTDPETGAFGSLSNFGTYAAGTLGEAIPSLAESVLTGIAGAALGAAVVPAPDPFDVATVPAGAVGGVLAKGAIKKAISNAAAEYVKRGVAAEAAEGLARQYVGREVAKRVGSTAATAAVTGLHEGGGMYMEGREAGYDSPGTALGLGLASGLSESLLGTAPGVLKSFAGRSGVDEIARREGWRAAAGYLWDTVKASGEEGVQEGFQEFLGSLNKEINDPNSDLFNKENFMQWAEAAAGGALVGGTVKSGTTGVELVGLRGGRGGRRGADSSTDPFLPQLPPEADTSEDLSNVQAEIALLENSVSRGSISRKEAQQLKLIADREETTSGERLNRAKAKLAILKDKEAILLSPPAQDSTAQPPAEQTPTVTLPPPSNDAFEQPTAPEPNAQQQPPVDPFNEEALINDEEVARQAAMEMERMRSETSQPAVPPSDQPQAPVAQPEAIPPSIDPFQPLSEQELPATSIQPSTDPFDEATAPKSPPTSEIDPFNVPVRQEPSTAQVQQPQSPMLSSDLVGIQEPTVDAQTNTTPVPAVKSPEDHASVPMFGVYETPFRGERKFFVKEFENRGAGDAMFDSLDEANKHSAIVARRNEEKVAREQKAKADEELAVKKQRDHEASFGGFLSADPKTKARQLKVLDSSRTYRGKVVTVKELIEQKVADGAVVNSEGQLESPDGAYLGSDKLTKFGIDYARHLIGSKPSDAVSAESQGEEVSDAQGTRKGGGPNVEVQTEGGQRPSEGQVSSGEEQAAESPSPAFSPTEQYIKLPEKSREKFEAAWKGNDPQAMKTLVHSGNKVLRAEFENRTGEKLPRTVKGTNEVVDRVYQGRVQPESATPSEAFDGKPKPPEGYKPLEEFTPMVTQTLSPDLELEENRQGIKELALKQGEAVGYRVYPKRGSTKGGYWQYGTVRYDPSGSHASIELADGTVELVGGSRLIRLEPIAATIPAQENLSEDKKPSEPARSEFVDAALKALDAILESEKPAAQAKRGRKEPKLAPPERTRLGQYTLPGMPGMAAEIDRQDFIRRYRDQVFEDIRAWSSDPADADEIQDAIDSLAPPMSEMFSELYSGKYAEPEQAYDFEPYEKITEIAARFPFDSMILSSIDDALAKAIEARPSAEELAATKKPPKSTGRKPRKSQQTLADAKSDRQAARDAAAALMKKIDGKLMSGVDPQLMAEAIQVAYMYVKADVKTFKGYVEAVIEDFSEAFAERLAPYMEAGWEALNIRGIVNDPVGKVDDFLSNRQKTANGDYGTPENPNRIALGRHFYSKLKNGESYARITDARKEASELIGGQPSNASAVKDIDEAVEIGVVLAARDIAQSGGADEAIYSELIDLYERQPNLGNRTSTSMAEQAYSTPAPLAFLVNKRAGVSAEDTVYDSSAGNGMLLIVGRERYANELNADRAESLRGQGIDTTNEDATSFTLGKPIDALVINPPFGLVNDESGKPKSWVIDGVRTDKVDHAITLQSIKEIPKDGKVAIIVGAKGFEKSEPKTDSRRGAAYLAEKRFYDALYDNYNVTDHFTVHGDLYRRQGASFPVDVIIIDGKGKSQRPKPYNIVGGGIPEVFRTWEDLKDAKLRPVSSVSSTSTGRDEGTDSATMDSGNEATVEGDAEALSPRPAGARVGGTDGRKPDPERLGGVDGQSGTANETDAKATVDGGTAGSERGGRDSGRRYAGGSDRSDSRVGLKPDETAETDHQVSYSPGSGNQSVDTLIPRNHQAAVAKSLDAVAEIYGDIDKFVASELGYDMDEFRDVFSAEQVDALALAIARHKDGGAFIIGDQTGVGKGRAAAAMMVYANRNGMVPVFITEKPTLYADMVRDLIDIRQSTEESPFNILMTNSLSGKDVIPLPDGRVLKQSSNAAKENLSKAVASVLNGNMLSVEAKTRKSGKNNAGSEPTVYNAVFTTYSQMQPVRQLTPERAIQLKRISSKSFFVLDESHNAGGTGDSDPDQQGGRSGGQDATITRAEIVRDLIGDAAGVYFSSATYAKRPQTMGLYARTGMTAATNGDPNALAEAIATGGVPLQQVVSEQLVESGMYLRRERSFDGVEFNPKTVDVDLANLDNVASIFSAINFFDNYAQEAIQELSDEVTSSGGSIAETEATGQAGLESTSFASILHNLVDQMLLAVKADAVANETIESIKNGEAPVIYVDSTFEAALKRQVEEVGASQGDEIDFSYKDLVRRYLERSREYTTRTDADDPDSVVRIRLTDAQLGPAGVAAYERALGMIDGFKGNMPASPIDWIRKRVTDAGYSISEITGRQVILDYGDDEKVRLGKRPDDEEGAGGRTKTVSRFNNGELDAVLINQSGSTGISMHSSEKFANKKPRHMIIGQPARNIDTFMQSLGRVHRTGQVVLPRFTLLMTNAPAEIRPASVLMKKLSSLNANVTASAKGAVSFDAPDVINVIGDQVVAEYLADNLPLNQALGEIVQLRRDGTPKRNPGIAKKASGRMALRPVAEQKDFWDSVIASYDELIEELNRVGKNPLVASTIDLKAKTIESVTIFDGDEGSSNLFMHPASVETVTANKPGKPMTADEVVAAVSNFYGNPASQSAVDEWVASTREEVAAAYQEYVSMMTKDLSGEDLQHVLMTYQLTGSRQLENLMERIALFAPGNSVSVHERSADGSLLEVIPGYVTKVKRLKGGNPLSASKWVADIAIASPDRIAKAALSRTGEQDPDSAVGRGGTYLEFRSNNELLSDVGLREFEESDLSATEIRYIGVGNILAAYSQLGKAGGQITFFTDSNGEIRRGVLMPRSFRIDRWNEARPVVLDDVDQAHQFLSQGGQLITPDRVLALMMVRGELIARAPKAKSRSGKYTINSTILRAASPHEFGSIGSRMEMAVPDMERQKRVLSAIMSVASLQAVGTDKNLARRVKESTPSKSEQKLGDKLDDLNDTLMQTAPDAINREMLLQATELAIAAEKAGIDVYDRLVAFAVKKLGEQRTREIGAYLYHAGNAAGMKGVRPTRDVLGTPGVTREQAVKFAKAAFPMLTDEQIEAGIDLVERLGMLDKIGFAPFGSPTPGVSDNQGDENNVKGWISFITAARAVVGATKDADVSTFVHEVFHAVRRFTLDRSIPQDKRSGITDAEIMALEKYAGVKYEKDANGNDDFSKPIWDRNAEEKADKAWEQYWFEGKAPNSALEGLFEKIARWMRGVYKSIDEITGGKLPQEVRDLFDKIVQRGGGVPPGRTTGTAQPADGRGEDLTSIKNAMAEERAVMREAIHMWDAATETSQEWLDDAERKIRADPYIGIRLVDEINSKARNLSNTEVAILQLHYRHINNLYENASERMFAAHNSGDIAEKARLRIEVDTLAEGLWDIEEAAKAAGREWGRAGVARQIVLRKDFSMAAMLRKARVANNGNPLNEEQTAEIERLAKQVAELEGKLAKAEQEKTDLERQARAQKDINDEKKRTAGASRKSESKKQAASKLQDFAKKFANIFGFKQSDTDTLQQTEDERMAEEAESVVQAYVESGVFSLGELMANVKRDLGSELPMQARVAFAAAWRNLKLQGDIPTPTVDANNSSSLTRLARRILRALVESGVTDRDEVVDAVQESFLEMDIELTKRETMDVLSGYGQFTPLSNNETDRKIRDITGQLQQVAKLQDMGYELIDDEWVKVREGVAPQKTGVERRTPTDEERELIRQVNEAKRQGGYKITDPESQLRSAVDAAKRAAENRIYDLKKAIDEEKPIVGNKTSLAGKDKELDDLRKQLAEWTEKYRDLFPKPEATMEQRIAATNRVLDAEIATIRRQLLSGDVMPKGRKDPVSTPEIEAKRARLEALRAQRETLQLMLNPNMKNEQAAKAYMAALLKQIADYQERLAKNDFDPKPKKPLRILTKEELLLKNQLEDVKDQFFRKAADYRLANMSPGEKAWDYTKEWSHLSRALMTSFDLSAVFRQGGVASFSHPKLATQVGRDMLKALRSKQSEFDIAERIRNHPLYQFAMTAKLAITEDEARITKQEEAFMGRWVRWGIGKEGSTVNKLSKAALLPVRASGRAYTTYLNGMRFELFKLMVDGLGGTGRVTADEAKIIAQYVNVATGRADLGKFNQAATNMSVVFFAPRYVASRFQYLAMPFYLLPSSKISGRVKKAIAMEYARYISSVSLFLGSTVIFGGLLAGDDDDEKPKVELDPRSTDFLKIRIGETRIDPMAGFSQIATFTTQVLSGQRKKQDGEVRDMRGENLKWGDKTTWDVMADFARKKLAPVPGAAVDLVSGENVIGEKETPLTVATGLFVPLSWGEVKESMQSRGIPAGTAISALALLGMGGGTYGPKTQYANGNEEQRKKQLEKDIREMDFDSPDPAYSEFLTEKQIEQVKIRREERRQDLAYAASASPNRKDYQSDENYQKAIASRDAAMKKIRQAGMGPNELRMLLLAYWKRTNKSPYELRSGAYQLKKPVQDRIRQIRRQLSDN